MPVRLVLAADPRRGGPTLDNFLIRLQCQACGARPASAALIADGGGPGGDQGGLWGAGRVAAGVDGRRVMPPIPRLASLVALVAAL